MTVPGRRVRAADELSDAVTEAAEALIAAWGRAFDTLGARISPSQLRALIVVSRDEGLNLGRLAEAIGAIPSSASRLCDRLQAAGLLHREVCTGNRREVTLALTPQGRTLLAELARLRREDIGQVLERMSPQGRQALLAGLTEFSSAIEPGPGQRPAWDASAPVAQTTGPA
jgi:DNA-binding MarR family transcriptional regulator